jgi:type I restriction enzyme, S subunit
MRASGLPFTDLLSAIVDNRGRTCPTAATGMPLIATNCVKNDGLYPVKEKVRYVDGDTYATWFRGHPQAGDILFVCKGSPGCVAMVPEPVDFCIAQDMVAVRADPAKVYPNYLFAALRSPDVQAQIAAMHVGTMIPHFKKGDFGNLMISVPGSGEQRFIGDLYVGLSRKIESNRRIADLALELAYQRRGAISRDSGVVALSSLVEINGVTRKSGAANETVHYIDIASVSPGRVDSVQPIAWGEAPSRARRVVRDGDVIFSTVRPGRRSFALILDPQRLTLASTGFATLTPLAVGSAFLTATVADPTFADYLDSVAHGSAYPAVSVEALGRFEAHVPDPAVLDDFEAEMMPILRRAAVADRETATLIALRDALLQELLSGRLKVPGAGRLVEAAT